MLLVSDGVDALGELVSSGVETGGSSVVASLVSSNSLALEVDVGANEVQELLSGVVSEGVGLSGVSLPTLGLGGDLSNDVVVDGVRFGGDHGA